MAAQATPRAVLLDALGTLDRLEPPAPRLRARLRERLGVEVDEARVARAMAAEIAYYRTHLQLGRDEAGLARVRAGCAAVVASELGLDAPLEAVRDALLAAIEFTAFDDAAPALQRLRARGARLAVVSNWDVSLHEVLARTGLRELVDAVVSSAEVGAAKPDPAPFVAALDALGVPAARAWHVGDTVEEDVAGARAAGVVPVLIARGGAPAGAAASGVRIVASLNALP
jgi:putative hydrolase of the HAD superfamily